MMVDDYQLAMLNAMLDAGCSPGQAEAMASLATATLKGMADIVRREMDITIREQPSVASEIAKVQDFLGSVVRREVAKSIKPRLVMKGLEEAIRRVVREEIGATMRAILNASDVDVTGVARATVEVAMEDALAVMAEAQVQ